LPTKNGYEYFTFRDKEQDNTPIEVKNTIVVGRAMNDVEKAIGDIEDLMQNIIRKNNITKEDLKNPTKSCHYQVISLEKATKALEKQMPKKPTTYDKTNRADCPACGATVRGISKPFGDWCSKCGQKLDWSERDETNII
jgi:hypothetical protein